MKTQSLGSGGATLSWLEQASTSWHRGLYEEASWLDSALVTPAGFRPKLCLRQPKP
jgi:hypothetical protein